MGRDETILTERIHGSTLREIGERHGLSAEGVRQICARESIEHISRIQCSIWAAQAQGYLWVFVVPAGSATEQAAAVSYFDWVLHELAKGGGLDIKVHYRPTPEGSFAFALEDANFARLLEQKGANDATG
jgi:hypothetical protein